MNALRGRARLSRLYDIVTVGRDSEERRWVGETEKKTREEEGKKDSHKNSKKKNAWKKDLRLRRIYSFDLFYANVFERTAAR